MRQALVVFDAPLLNDLASSSDIRQIKSNIRSICCGASHGGDVSEFT